MLETTTNRKARAVNAVLPVLLLALTFVLVLYIGYGKAQRTYPALRVDSLASVGEIAQHSLGTFLAAGLPLQQFVGFSTLTRPLLLSEPSISELRVVDRTGGTVFRNPPSDVSEPTPDARLEREGQKYSVYADERFLIVSLPLRNKFATVASLEIVTERTLIRQRIREVFAPTLLVGVILLGAYLVVVLLSERLPPKKANLWTKGAYVAAFVLLSMSVLITLVGLLSSGIQDKGRALSESLSARLDAALEMGIDLSSFTELDATFKEYQDLNPEIEYIALTEDALVTIHTEAGQVGRTWRPQGGVFEFSQALKTEPARTDLRFGVSKKLLYNSLWRYGKDFLVLLVASGFLSILFLNIGVSFKRRAQVGAAGHSLASEQALKRELVHPVYFLAVFMEGLHASFLPQFMKSVARQSGLGAGAASAIFMAYFAAYTLTIIPAGWYAQRRGPKLLIATGAVLSAGGLALLSIFQDFGPILLVRMLSGAGGGMLFIGIQHYLLQHTTRETRTQGGAIIVYAYNGGTLSGAAIGAMLALYIGTRGVFILGAAVGAAVLLYSLRYVETTPRIPEERTASKARLRDFLKVFADASFLKTVFLVGIPTKVILTGVTIYALPLLLASRAFPQEDIGQILMFYAAGVLISSRYASVLADRLKNTKLILLLGMLGAGVGLGLIGLMSRTGTASYLSALVVVSGMLILGLSHGFVHAPIVTHITETRSARTLGQAGVASFYRFLERIGHVTGPLIVSAVLVALDDSTLSISLMGAGTIALGLVFAAGTRQAARPQGRLETDG